MIDARELRIGNLIYVHGKAHTVTSINCSHKDSPPHLFLTVEGDKRRRSCFLNDRVSGIPLTENWLIRFGFAIVEEWEDMGMWGKGELKVWWYDEKHRKDVMLHSCKPANFKYQYVHQLQNIYFALTGTELPISKPDKIEI